MYPVLILNLMAFVIELNKHKLSKLTTLIINVMPFVIKFRERKHFQNQFLPCKFLLEHFKGYQDNDKGQGSNCHCCLRFRPETETFQGAPRLLPTLVAYSTRPVTLHLLFFSKLYSQISIAILETDLKTQFVEVLVVFWSQL